MAPAVFGLSRGIAKRHKTLWLIHCSCLMLPAEAFSSEEAARWGETSAFSLMFMLDTSWSSLPRGTSIDKVIAACVAFLMAFRPILRMRLALPVAALAFAGTTLIPKNTLHAEEPYQASFSRKPIYDDPPSRRLEPISKPSPSTPSTSPSASPTLTDRLASQIRRSRLFLQVHVSLLESHLNAAMTRTLHLEHSFTSTIASLAPPKGTNEHLLPGGLYVLVAAMAGSIVSRNRNILIRATFPLAVGIGAGWIVLPHTMRNVGDLVWKFEERAPVVAMNHLRIKGAVEEGWKQAKGRGQVVGKWADERVKEAREAAEGWVRKGR